jgi:hypothetical protein
MYAFVIGKLVYSKFFVIEVCASLLLIDYLPNARHRKPMALKKIKNNRLMF